VGTFFAIFQILFRCSFGDRFMNSFASKLLVTICLLAGLIAWDSAQA